MCFGKNVNVLIPLPDALHHTAHIKRHMTTLQPRILGIMRDVHAKHKLVRSILQAVFGKAGGRSFLCHLITWLILATSTAPVRVPRARQRLPVCVHERMQRTRIITPTDTTDQSATKRTSSATFLVQPRHRNSSPLYHHICLSQGHSFPVKLMVRKTESEGHVCFLGVMKIPPPVRVWTPPKHCRHGSCVASSTPLRSARQGGALTHSKSHPAGHD